MLTDRTLFSDIPLFKDADADLIEDIQQNATLKTIPAGQQLAFEGDQSEWFFILLSGRLRVFKLSETGREVTLYHVEDYQSCVLTIFSILSHTRFPAFAVSETELRILMIPARKFKSWVDLHALWREHVFQALSCRLQDILDTLDRVTFQRVDVRVAKYLLQFSKQGQQPVRITHEKLASELGSSRVVVSRILERFHRIGLVQLSRGMIEIISVSGLQDKIIPPQA